MMIKFIALLAIPAAVLLAPVAHADEQAFLNDLQAQGVVMLPGAELEAGYHACTDMRAGASPDAASHYGYWTNQFITGWSRKIVDTAQRDLCPDTIH
jgi:hypothetical protein